MQASWTEAKILNYSYNSQPQQGTAPAAIPLRSIAAGELGYPKKRGISYTA